ncbi:hypothetical protein Tco_0107405, partial [Tanacetum coccineum]
CCCSGVSAKGATLLKILKGQKTLWDRNRTMYVLNLLYIFWSLEVLYMIEFHKRGLPHCHTLLWIDDKDKIQCAEDIDSYIFAELPDPIEDPEWYRIISEMMIHGPCGPPEPTSIKIGMLITAEGKPMFTEHGMV